MGIINTTPDSFYEGSRFSQMDQIIRIAEKMIEEGTDILDIGGYSSRPGAAEVSEEEEYDRVIPAIDAVHRSFPDMPISIDTFRSGIARAGLEAGAVIVNDITAGLGDESMLKVAAHHSAVLILMHMRGTPATMGSLTHYDRLISEIALFLGQRIRDAEKAGISDIVIDPGFGFAKTIDQNFEMLCELEYFNICKRPVLVGFSRKSMIWRSLEIDASKALNGTTALNMAALMKGASILRVHDVRPAVECVELFVRMKKATTK
jgi:dihydropteroate synthase